MICCICLQERRRSFFHNGICDQCDPYNAMPPEPPPGTPTRQIRSVLSPACIWHEEHGWVTEAEARDKGVRSSATMLREHMEDASGYRRPETTFTPLAEAAWDWFKTLGDKPEAECSGYECSLVLLYRTGFVTAESFPLAASIYHAWKRSLETAGTPLVKPEPTGTHLGTLKQRIDIPGCQCYEHRSLGVSEEHPEYGERFLIKFTSASGADIVWFASSGGKFDPQKGGLYNIRATVAKHDEYAGKRQTLIQRPAEYNPVDGKLLHPPKRKSQDDSDV